MSDPAGMETTAEERARVAKAQVWFIDDAGSVALNADWVKALLRDFDRLLSPAPVGAEVEGLVASLDELAGKATARPWSADYDYTDHAWLVGTPPQGASPYHEQHIAALQAYQPNVSANAAFIVALVNAYPQLRATLSWQASEIDQLKRDKLALEAIDSAAEVRARNAEAENARLTGERDEARALAKKIGNALMDFTPGGSEYFVTVQGDYYADADFCQRVIRERIDGHCRRANTAMRETKAAEQALLAERQAHQETKAKVEEAEEIDRALVALAKAAVRISDEMHIVQPFFAVWKEHGEIIEMVTARLATLNPAERKGETTL